MGQMRLPLAQPLLDHLDRTHCPHEQQALNFLLKVMGQATLTDRRGRREIGRTMQRLAARLDY